MKHTIELFNGDCLSVMQSMQEKSFDFCFTSPPYNRKRNDKYRNYEDKKEDYYDFLDTVISLSMKKCKYAFFNVQKKITTTKKTFSKS